VDWLLWLLGGVLVAGGSIWTARALVWDRARGRRRCAACWYDMAGLPGLTCPECGRAAGHERRLARTRRYWRRAVVGALVVSVGTAGLLTPRLRRRGWIGAVPTPVLNLVLSFFDQQADALFQSNQTGLGPGVRATMSSGSALGSYRSVVIGGGVASTGGMSAWERLLIARHCSRALREEARAERGKITGTFDFGGSSRRWPLYSTLQGLGDESRVAVPTLIDVIERGPFIDRVEAMTTLSGIGAAAHAAVPALRRVIDEDVNGAQVAAAIGKILGAADDRGGLQALLGERSRLLRVAGATGLKDMKGRAAPAVGALVRAVEADPEIAGVVMAALESVGARAVPGLSRLLRAGTPRLRVSAAATIHSLHAGSEDEAAAVLAGLVDDPDRGLRDSALMVLAQIGRPAAATLPVLQERLTQEPDAGLRLRICTGVRGIGGDDPRVVAILTTALSDPDQTVRLAGANQLRLIGAGAGKAAPALERLANDPWGFVREAAAGALEAIRHRD
jgi:hypothetical protein